MLDFTKQLIEYVGSGNIITVLIFVISSTFGYFLYFRSFYRMIYTTQTICKTCERYEDWANGKHKLNTRIIFYNNGRKTISKKQIEQLEIIVSDELEEILLIRNIENLKIAQSKRKCVINFNNLDSKEFFVIELLHKGNLEILGRISESGKLIHTEPKNWIAINAVIMIMLMISLFYNMFNLLNQDEPKFMQMLIFLLFAFGVVRIMRFMHGLFFIPDKLTWKFADSKDKWQKAFKS